VSSIKVSRRDFFKAGLACLGTIGFGHAGSDKGRMGAQAAQALPGRSVWTWLRMFEVQNSWGTIPSSEAAYRANADKIDVALPANGGRIQGDGTWLQEPWKINPDWPQMLPSWASDAGHLYMPVVDNDKGNMEAYLQVLDDPSLQAAAAENLVTLATSGRFDAPWDGVLLDFEATPTTHRQQLSDFYYVLADRLKQAGLPMGISVAGRATDWGTHDFSVLAEVADFVDLRCYGYREPPPKSIAPYWWLEDSVRYALDQGISQDNLLLGLGNFSKHWPDSTQYDFHEVPHEVAMQLVAEAGATVQWIASNENGIVREWYASLGSGHIWIHDGRTHRYGLQLAEQFGLLGTSLFAPGMGDRLHWLEIDAWRSGGWYQHYLPMILKTFAPDGRAYEVRAQ
jgi:hypothetical protein